MVYLLCLQLHSEHLADAFTHSHTAGGVNQATANLSGAVRVRCLAQGHLDTQLGGAGDPTSKFLVQPPISTLYCILEQDVYNVPTACEWLCVNASAKCSAA